MSTSSKMKKRKDIVQLNIETYTDQQNHGFNKLLKEIIRLKLEDSRRDICITIDCSMGLKHIIDSVIFCWKNLCYVKFRNLDRLQSYPMYIDFLERYNNTLFSFEDFPKNTQIERRFKKSWKKRLNQQDLYFLKVRKRPIWAGGEDDEDIERELKSLEGGMIADLGCGHGASLGKLSERFNQVFGIDISQIAISMAKTSCKEKNNCILVTGDVADDIFPEGTFDVVIDKGCLHSLDVDSRDSYIHNLGQMLKIDGKVILRAFNNDNDTSDFAGLPEGFTPHFYSKEELRSLFERRFNLIRYKRSEAKKFSTDMYVFEKDQ